MQTEGQNGRARRDQKRMQMRKLQMQEQLSYQIANY
jgi:hypothetical protein